MTDRRTSEWDRREVIFIAMYKTGRQDPIDFLRKPKNIRVEIEKNKYIYCFGFENTLVLMSLFLNISVYISFVLLPNRL